MGLLTYLLQVSGCITLFYVFYYACLSRLTFFTINRYYLIGSLILSFIVPLITIPVYSNYTVLTNAHLVPVPPVLRLVAKPAVTAHPIIVQHSITWVMILKWVYIAVCAVLLVQFATVLIGFFLHLSKQHVQHFNDLRIIQSGKKLRNGSFLNYIFVDSAKLKNEEAEQVIAHEILHIRLNHSIDRILGRLAQILLWFNPVVYLFTRAIEQNHEFEVDSLLTDATNKQSYAGLLLQLSVKARGLVYNNFAKTPLQQRIVMLFNKKSSKSMQMVYLLILPLLMLSFVAFANLKRIVLPRALSRSVMLVSTVGNKSLISEPTLETVLSPKGNTNSEVETSANANETSSSAETDTVRLSVIKGVDRLGNNPLVLIDGKEYPSDILYTIGSGCIRGTDIWIPDSALKYYGPNAKDGLVKISTRDGKIREQTAIDKANLVVEQRSKSDAPLIRITLQKEDGTLYDRVTEKRINGGWSEVEVSHNAKVAFFVDTTFYSEEQMIKLFAESGNHFRFGGSNDLYQTKMPDGNLHGYEAVMYLFTSVPTAPHNEQEAKIFEDRYTWEKHIPIK